MTDALGRREDGDQHLDAAVVGVPQPLVQVAGVVDGGDARVEHLCPPAPCRRGVGERPCLVGILGEDDLAPRRIVRLEHALRAARATAEQRGRLGEDPATVLYHVRTLVRTGFLAREDERRGRRGAKEIPYRSTRKSWTLSFEPDAVGHLAMLDATRAELVEAGPDAVLTLTRMAVRLDAARLEELERRIVEFVNDADDADGSGDESIGVLIAVHRRR